jgi:hypothetical protein
MQLLKRVGLGLMFWVDGTIGFLILGIIIGIVRGSATTGPAHAIERIEHGRLLQLSAA